MNARHIMTATSVAAPLPFTLLKGYFPSNINENYMITMWAFLTVSVFSYDWHAFYPFSLHFQSKNIFLGK